MTVKYLKIADVAEMLNVSKMTIYRLTQNGELGAVKVGQTYRIPEDALKAYLEKNTI